MNLLLLSITIRFKVFMNNILQTVVGKLDENLKEMTLQTDFMTKKMEEMDDAKVMMDRVVSKTQLLIDEKE